MRAIVRALLGPAEPDMALVDAAPALAVKTVFRRFWPDARPFRGWLCLGLALVALSPVVSSAEIYLFKVVVDDVLTPRNFQAFPAVALAYVGLTILSGLLSFANQYLAVWNGEHFLLRLRNRVFAHLHTLSPDFFDRRRLGDTLSRLTGDIGAIESLVLSGVAQTVSSLLQIVVFTAVLFVLDWRLALVAMLAVPLFWTVARVFSRRIKAASREARRRSGSLATVAEESLGNATLIQAYGREDAEEERFAGQGRASVAAVLRAARVGAGFGPLIDLIEVFGVLTILGAGLLELSADRITVGGLLAFLIYLSQFYGPVRGLGQFTNTAYAAAAGAERVIELLDQRPQVATPPDPIPLDEVRGDLSLRHVGFRYPATERDALQDVTLDMPAGSTTALVGPSGAGKTSLTKLLLRLHDPTSGQIYLDGHELRKLDPAALRRHLAVVLQETLLLDGTIAENILAGRPEAGPDELRAAACAADAHEFITALPDGYDTRVGQRGRLLSGGQRQRIAIARAMIRDAPVLILDEPTASLDAAAAQRILTPMRRLMRDRTTLVISHNLLTVTDADQIVLLERGQVAEIGTHEQLLANDRRYAQLFRLHRPAGQPASTHPRPSPRPRPRPFPQTAAQSPHPSPREAAR